MTSLPDSWHRAWRAAGARDHPLLGRQLLACYAEPQRGYHTVQHLGECIAAFEPVMALAEHTGEVEVALWFHDAIYDVRSHDNEQRSADWAAAALAASGAPHETAARVHTLILATRHSALPESPDAKLLVDIDLAILGAAPARFDEYELQVRKEYAWVPEAVFREKRRAVLQQFLARPVIYSTEAIHNALEASARRNLRRSIARLEA